jgi:hypothetical protein
MWNFVGRQNDIQGRYDSQDGNWMSGIKFMNCTWVLQDNLPEDVLQNKAKRLLFSSILLGLIGLMYHE